MSIYTNKEMALLYDSSKCTGCKGCQVACKQWNTLYSPLGLNEQKFTGSYQAPLDLNGDTRLVMTFSEKEGKKKWRPVEWAFGRRSCFHCTDAACVEVCPSGALFKRDNGVVSFDENKCIGCTYCSQACPFEVPRYHGPQSKIDKCTMCFDRLENGKVPACVQTCQPEALCFGPRDEMLKKAKARIEFLKARGYDKAEIYGEKEMGGLHVIQICKYGIDAHGLPANPSKGAGVAIAKIAAPAAGALAAATAAGLALSFVASMGYRRENVSVEEKKAHWDDRQKARADELLKEHLAKEARE
ncbi:MAG: 4Fe-4S dicluster domain-containing protein [Duodenibacillus sp.]|nr:4Fe-4S dicluster domain-containing protein [Duodenibacillus sp.]